MRTAVDGSTSTWKEKRTNEYVAPVKLIKMAQPWRRKFFLTRKKALALDIIGIKIRISVLYNRGMLKYEQKCTSLLLIGWRTGQSGMRSANERRRGVEPVSHFWLQITQLLSPIELLLIIYRYSRLVVLTEFFVTTFRGSTTKNSLKSTFLLKHNYLIFTGKQYALTGYSLLVLVKLIGFSSCPASQPIDDLVFWSSRFHLKLENRTEKMSRYIKWINKRVRDIAVLYSFMK